MRKPHNFNGFLMSHTFVVCWLFSEGTPQLCCATLTWNNDHMFVFPCNQLKCIYNFFFFCHSADIFQQHQAVSQLPQIWLYMQSTKVNPRIYLFHRSADIPTVLSRHSQNTHQVFKLYINRTCNCQSYLHEVPHLGVAHEKLAHDVWVGHHLLHEGVLHHLPHHLRVAHQLHKRAPRFILLNKVICILTFFVAALWATSYHTGTDEEWLLLLFVVYLPSQQHASVSQGRICSDKCMYCNTEKEVADQTFYLTQSQYTDTGPTSPSTDPITH